MMTPGEEGIQAARADVRYEPLVAAVEKTIGYLERKAKDYPGGDAEECLRLLRKALKVIR